MCQIVTTHSLTKIMRCIRWMTTLCLSPDIKRALLKNGYIYIGMGGGITGDMQINDTDMHLPLKQNYRRHEQELMIKKLREDPTKIPTVGRNEIMNLIIESWNELKVDVEARYKSLWLTNALDGREDSLTSDKLFQLVRHDFLDYREKLTNSEPTATLKALTIQITPPKGVRGRKIPENGEKPDDGIEV